MYCRRCFQSVGLISCRNVNDIDLFVGGISEQSVPDGIAGPTFACIIGHTFRNLRRGDRMGMKMSKQDSLQVTKIRSLSSMLVTMDSQILAACYIFATIVEPIHNQVSSRAIR
jgi:peroxidase